MLTGLYTFIWICCLAASVKSSHEAQLSTPDHGLKIQGIGSRSKGYVLGLKHRDFIIESADQATSTDQRLLRAFERSRRRANHFKLLIEKKASGNLHPSASGFEAPIIAGDGAFLTSFYLGTPPRNVTAIMDTGSDLVWQQCKPCDVCFSQPDAIFDPSQSTTYKTVSCIDQLCQALSQAIRCEQNCRYTYMYGDNSATRGDLAYDTLTLRDESGNARKIANFAFGCGHENEGTSFAKSDGLLGLGQGALSLTSQLSTNKFSYCLGSFMSSETSPLFLGDAAAMGESEGSQVEVTPLVTNLALPSFYYLSLKGISLDGTPLSIAPDTFALRSDGSGGMIIDSGTTITYLENSAYQILLKAIASRVKLPKVVGSLIGLDLCYSAVGKVPTLTFHFDGADMELPHSNLFISFAGFFCLAMSGSTGISILGNIQQQNFHFLYDRASSKISFTPTSCSTLLPPGNS